MTLTSVVTALTKAEQFLLRVLTGTNKVISTLSKVSGPTLAALLAVFYDALKTLAAAESAAASVETGNPLSTVQLSATTLALLQNVIADSKTAGSVIADDLKALGITL